MAAENVVLPPVTLTAMIFVALPEIAVPLTLIAPGPAKVIILLPAVEAVMPPVRLSVPPATWETLRPAVLLAVIAPLKVEIFAVLPPIVLVPIVLAPLTLMERAMVKAPLVSNARLSLAALVPDPSDIAVEAFPKTPLVETATLPPTSSVPALIVVAPV